MFHGAPSRLRHPGCPLPRWGLTDVMAGGPGGIVGASRTPQSLEAPRHFPWHSAINNDAARPRSDRKVSAGAFGNSGRFSIRGMPKPKCLGLGSGVPVPSMTHVTGTAGSSSKGAEPVGGAPRGFIQLGRVPRHWGHWELLRRTKSQGVCCLTKATMCVLVARCPYAVISLC